MLQTSEMSLGRSHHHRITQTSPPASLLSRAQMTSEEEEKGEKESGKWNGTMIIH